MPFCPECRYEFIDEIDTCPDCNKALVETLPEDAPLPEVKWVPLRPIPSKIYAEMVKEALENNRIPAFSKADFLQGAYGISATTIAGGNVVIYVPEKHFKAASAILHQMVNHL